MCCQGSSRLLHNSNAQGGQLSSIVMCFSPHVAVHTGQMQQHQFVEATLPVHELSIDV